jgi:hypothetical protein
MWLLPVPELPIAMMFSRRSMYSERASSMTRALFNEGSHRTRVVARRRPIGCSYLFIARWSEAPRGLDDVFVT